MSVFSAEDGEFAVPLIPAQKRIKTGENQAELKEQDKVIEPDVEKDQESEDLDSELRSAQKKKRIIGEDIEDEENQELGKRIGSEDEDEDQDEDQERDEYFVEDNDYGNESLGGGVDDDDAGSYD